MLIAEDLVSEEVCALYLDRFRQVDLSCQLNPMKKRNLQVDKTGDGKLDQDDLVHMANQERAKFGKRQTPSANNPLLTVPASPVQEEYPAMVPESFSTSGPGRDSYVATAEQEKVDDAIIGHAKEGGNRRLFAEAEKLGTR